MSAALIKMPRNYGVSECYEIYTAEIKVYDTKIKTLKAGIQGSRTLVRREKQKVKDRDAHLALRRLQWA